MGSKAVASPHVSRAVVARLQGLRRVASSSNLVVAFLAASDPACRLAARTRKTIKLPGQHVADNRQRDRAALHSPVRPARHAPVDNNRADCKRRHAPAGNPAELKRAARRAPVVDFPELPPRAVSNVREG